MSLYIPLEIAEIVVEYAFSSETREWGWKPRDHGDGLVRSNLRGRNPKRMPWKNSIVKHADANASYCSPLENFLALRRVSRAFQAAVDTQLFRRVTITRINKTSLTRHKKYINSPSISQAINTLAYEPFIYCDDPRDKGAYKYPGYPYDVYRDVRSGRGLVDFREQNHLMTTDRISRLADWLPLRLKKLIPRAPQKFPTTSLAKSSLFRDLKRLVNLSRLEISYPAWKTWQSRRKGHTRHWLAKIDLSVGLGTSIGNGLPGLKSIAIRNATVIDLKILGEAISDTLARLKRPNATNIKMLDIVLSHEVWLYRYLEDCLSVCTHKTKGKPLSDLIALMPYLEELTLNHPHGLFLSPKFDPPSLPCLQKLYLTGLSVSFTALQSLTCVGGLDAMQPTSLVLKNVMILKGTGTWASLFRSWEAGRVVKTHGKRPSTVAPHLPSGVMYCDDILPADTRSWKDSDWGLQCSDEDRTVLQRLSDTENQGNVALRNLYMTSFF